MIDVNDFMTNMTNDQRNRYLLKMNEGMPEPIFSYAWSRDGSRAGVNLQVIWRVPLKSEKEQRDQGLKMSQKNIDYLKQNTILFHSRAERSAYWATVINTNFISNRAAAQALYEFIMGDVMPKRTLSSEALAAARFALNSQDPGIIVDLRKLNGRSTNDLFDPLWVKMVVVVEGRVDKIPTVGTVGILYNCNIFM
jgi:hypothetical protein